MIKSLPVTDEGYAYACIDAAANIVMHIKYCMDADIPYSIKALFVGTDMMRHSKFYSQRNCIAPSLEKNVTEENLTDRDMKRITLEVKGFFSSHAMGALDIPIGDKYEIEEYLLEIVACNDADNLVLLECLELLDGKVDPVEYYEDEFWESSVHFPAIRYFFLETIEDVRKHQSLIFKTAQILQKHKGQMIEGYVLDVLTSWIEDELINTENGV